MLERSMPRVLPVDPESPSPAALEEAASVLARGGLVAFPTETVYGLGARGLHADEVAKIYRAKGRPSTHPLILHVTGSAMARGLARGWPEAAAKLAEAFWPGPLTLVVPRGGSVPDAVTGGGDTVGLRCPSHPVALALLDAVGEPLAAPSANAHTHVSPTSAAHVVRSLGDACDLVLDGGTCAHGIESTVVDVSGAEPRVLRPGALDLEALRRVLPAVQVASAALADDAVVRAAPGMAARHYAPRTRVILADDLEAELAVACASGLRVATLVWSEDGKRVVRGLADRVAVVAELPFDPKAYARALFAELHRVDAAGVGLVVVEQVPDTPGFWAVRDRLARAARPA